MSLGAQCHVNTYNANKELIGLQNKEHLFILFSLQHWELSDYQN